MSVAIIVKFIGIARDYGMPVSFFQRVLDEYTFEFKPGSGDEETLTTLNKIVLYEDTVAGLEITPEKSARSAIQTLYHEATHAYIDLMSIDGTPMFKRAADYYKGARLDNGVTVTKPDVVANEAAAAYVGHRAQAMWGVWEDIRFINSVLDRHDAKLITGSRCLALARMRVGKGIPQKYNDEMDERQFGYQPMLAVHLRRNADPEMETIQANVLKPLYPELKEYCDRVFLETDIKDRFQQMKVFSLAYEMMQFRLMNCEEDKVVIPDTMFDFGQDVLTPAGRETLRRVANDLKKLPQAKLGIEGHTDSVGGHAYNMDLSRRRAEAVKAFFIEEKVLGAEQFQTEGFGETRPVAPNRKPNGHDNPKGRQRNRRVEIRYL
jgi:outer membrane protein OmpA-like peptidoglycan-associated protein